MTVTLSKDFVCGPNLQMITLTGQEHKDQQVPNLLGQQMTTQLENVSILLNKLYSNPFFKDFIFETKFFLYANGLNQTEFTIFISFVVFNASDGHTYLRFSH
jgi:hypothetical protein